VDETLSWLQEQGLAFESEGALWFRSTSFGDDKDRVLRKSDGDLTYFASDVAYHADKFSRGFSRLIDVWGADHHGYVPRMKAAVQALGRDADDLQVVLIQLVNLMRSGEQVAMSTRAGQFVTLAEVCNEVGVDAARFIFLSRKSDSHLDVDLDLLKQQSMDNPVYYVQYAHARIHSIFKKAAERGLTDIPSRESSAASLQTAEDLEILKAVDRFPEVLQGAARTLSPHHVSYYLLDLAGMFHRYYNTHSVVNASRPEQTQARLLLLQTIAQVLRNGLHLLGVTAPEQM
jgi:arginyl-tRNA synthetase